MVFDDIIIDPTPLGTTFGERLDAGHLRSQTGQSEDDLVVAAAEHGDTLAGNIAEPFEFR
jgi:hypothetical protein